jgi:hypothetical protein
MIRNEKGLWVKAKDSDVQKSKPKSAGRGSGISIFADVNEEELHSKSYDYDDYPYKKSKRCSDDDDIHYKKSRYDDNRRRGSDRDKSYHDEYDDKRSYDEDRRKRSDRSRDFSRSENNRRYREQDIKDGYDEYRDRKNTDRNDRGQDKNFEEEYVGKQSSDHYEATANKKEDHNESDDEVDLDIGNEFHFNAIQIVNRFLELFGYDLQAHKSMIGLTKKEGIKVEPSEYEVKQARLDLLEKSFTENAIVASMKTNKVLLSGHAAIRSSFGSTRPLKAECTRRLFIPDDKGQSSHNLPSDEEVVSYCLDLHIPNSSPGLGDPTKDVALLYECVSNKHSNPDSNPPAIRYVWGAIDPDKLASKDILTKDMLYESKVWQWCKSILYEKIPNFDECETHFHDYTSIETWS